MHHAIGTAMPHPIADRHPSNQWNRPGGNATMVTPAMDSEEMELVQKKNRELETILDVSRVLTASFELEENLERVMSFLADHLQMQRGCVFLLDSGNRELKIVAAHDLNASEMERGTYRIGEGIVGRVIETGSPMFVPNIGDEPMFLNRTGSRPDKAGISFLCMPIEMEDKILGVIGVDRIYASTHGNVDDDLRVLRIIASQIAQFVKLWEHYKNRETECGTLRTQLIEKYSIPNIVGESEQLQSVLKSVIKVAGTDTTVLLLGESGTGKELIARTLHFQSHRAKGPFVPVNLAALPETLIEAELFGVEKGAFTGASVLRKGRFEKAQGGTLFLDEIGELPLQLQVKLLRVLQEKQFERVGASTSIRSDVRVVAATNRNLSEEVKAGKFREDLYWRLNVVPIVLPPLRERARDVALLVDYYLEKFNTQYNRRIALSDAAYDRLSSYEWPGNIRELANTVERMVIMSESRLLTEADLPRPIQTDAKRRPVGKYVLVNLDKEVEILERRHIVAALEANGYVQYRASQSLGITPRQLGYKIRKYAIPLR